MLKRRFIYVRILLLTKYILFVCIKLRIMLFAFLLLCIFYMLECTVICESNSVELQLNLFIIIRIIIIIIIRIIIITRCKYFDPCYARATVVRASFLAAAFSDGSYLAHVKGAYLRHVTFCIVRGPTPFVHRVAYL